jgi:two-component system, NarL family, sensor histidine kinase DegS
MDLVERLRTEIETLDRELAEIDMLVGQTKAEAARHEQKRATVAARLGAPGDGEAPAQAEAWNQLVTLTRRAVLMDAQVDVLDGKRRALARHRDALVELADALATPEPAAAEPAGDEAASEADRAPLPPSVSRVVLGAQEDLRREIARSMHDGPAQSLTNIVLQAQIVARLMDRDPTTATGEMALLVSMVQQTLDATKSFIFDVRPMVLDDLGLVPTLRRAARERGRRAHVPVGFESLGQDRRLPMDVETTVFRIVDEALTGYLALGPDRVQLTADWTDELEVRIVADRAATMPEGLEPLPEIPTGDVPDAIREMIQERHNARQAVIEAAETAAIVVLPPATQRDITERAGTIGATAQVLAGGGELRVLVALPPAGSPEPGSPESTAQPAVNVPGDAPAEPAQPA